MGYLLSALIIIGGIFGVIVMLTCKDLPGNSGSGHVFSGEELDKMCWEMVGKSKKECQEILKKYQK